ncbi:MAG: FAD-dependent oxidoreductase [Vicinamibacterales bacterium]
MSGLPHVVVLGGGPAGCGAAYQLRRTGKATVSLIEAQDVVGGNAGSFQWGGQWLDFGSHRLHHTVAPDILADIQHMLGPDFGDFARHGRILLRNRWLHFPIKPLDLLRRLDKGFALRFAADAVTTKLARKSSADSFASVLLANLGPTMSHGFYFPYARKMWGREAEELSAIQARKRVTAGSIAKLLRRLVKPVGKGHYYYMREGYGQISRRYADEARALGAEIALRSTASRVERDDATGRWRVTVSTAGDTRVIDADHVWSTIPIPVLAGMTHPAAGPDVQAAARAIQYRAMVLVYVQLPVDQYTTTDAHYFPEEHIRLTRLSEPKNYFRSTEPRGTTVLCGEYPCTVGDSIWTADEATMARQMATDVAAAGIPFPAEPVAVLIRHLPQAYPIYLTGYEHPFGVLDRWASSHPGMLVYGRQGLFAHDNTHHALFMAYAAVDCLDGTRFDDRKWHDYRQIFATHVVED